MNTTKIALQDYLLGLRHVGFIVADLDAAVAAMQRVYGLPDTAIRRVGEAGAPARFAFLSIADGEFELIEPLSAELKATLLAQPSGPAGINHVAWRVSDLDACLQILAEQGIVAGHVTPDGPVDLGRLRFVYLDPADCDGQLIELIELADD